MEIRKKSLRNPFLKYIKDTQKILTFENRILNWFSKGWPHLLKKNNSNDIPNNSKYLPIISKQLTAKLISMKALKKISQISENKFQSKIELNYPRVTIADTLINANMNLIDDVIRNNKKECSSQCDFGNWVIRTTRSITQLFIILYRTL